MDTETGRRVQRQPPSASQQHQQPTHPQQYHQQQQPAAAPLCEESARRLAGTDRQPLCAADGTFAPLQCRGSTCFCVDEKGGQLPYRSRPQDRATCRE